MDLYTDADSDAHGDQISSWNSSSWICPDIASINESERKFESEDSIKMFVYSCEEATEHNYKTSYVDPSTECLSNFDVNTFMVANGGNVRLRQKFMSTIFDPELYHREKQYNVVTRHINSKLTWGQAPICS